MKKLILFAAALLLVSGSRAADPETEMRAAVDDLVNASSYSWRRWTERPDREAFDAAKKAGFDGLGVPAATVIIGRTDRENFSTWKAT